MLRLKGKETVKSLQLGVAAKAGSQDNDLVHCKCKKY